MPTLAAASAGSRSAHESGMCAAISACNRVLPSSPSGSRARANLRPFAGDSAPVEATKLVARTHQSLIWDRTRQVLRLRSALREVFPAALSAFDDLAAPDTPEVPGRAPDPDRAASLSRSQIAAALRRARRRGLEAKAAAMQQVLRSPQLRQPAPVQAAYAAIVTTQVRLVTTLNTQIEQLGEVVAAHFGLSRHECGCIRPFMVTVRGVVGG
jgi:hypothetical protein